MGETQQRFPRGAMLDAWSRHEWDHGVQIDKMEELQKLAVRTRNSLYEITILCGRPCLQPACITMKYKRLSPGGGELTNVFLVLGHYQSKFKHGTSFFITLTSYAGYLTSNNSRDPILSGWDQPMFGNDNTNRQIIEFEARATQATYRRVTEHARFFGKKNKKPRHKIESQIEDEFFKLADRMGGETELQKQQSHTTPPESEHEGQQRLWRELQWEAEQRDWDAHHKGSNKKSGTKATGKSKPSVTRKKAA